MLKHDDITQSPSPAAAQVRVTPEELAAAVTALQIRKEGQPGTIAIGEAVEELGLNVTPEEVLAEVQAGRAKPKRNLDYRALVCAVACMVAPGLIFVICSMLPQPKPSQSFSNSSYSTSPAVGITATPLSVFDNSNHRIQLDLDHLQVGDASGKLLLISEVKENQTVRCPFYPGNSTFGDYPGNSHVTWTLIKHEGKLYMRGWIPYVSSRLLQADGVNIQNGQDAEHSVPITLLLTGFKVRQGDEGNEEASNFNAEDMHLDSHAYEKW